MRFYRSMSRCKSPFTAFLVTSKRAHHEQQTTIDIGVQIVVVGGGQGGEEKGRGESCERCY